MILNRRTWVYEKGNSLYVSDCPLNIKGAKLLSRYEINRINSNDSFEHYLYNPTIRYYLNEECIFSNKRYANKVYYYIILKDNKFYKMSSEYKYYNTNKIKVIPISTTIFNNININYLYHEEIYQEYE